jgi:hypothetical protein
LARPTSQTFLKRSAKPTSTVFVRFRDQ